MVPFLASDRACSARPRVPEQDAQLVSVSSIDQ
jgi:hypothetical protein